MNAECTHRHNLAMARNVDVHAGNQNTGRPKKHHKSSHRASAFVCGEAECEDDDEDDDEDEEDEDEDEEEEDEEEEDDHEEEEDDHEDE